MEEMEIKTIKKAYIQSLENGTTRAIATKAARTCTSTIWNWRRDDEEFAKAEEAALESRIMVVEDALLRNAKNGNTIAQIFFLKNRGKGKWLDKQVIDVKVPDTIRVKAFIQAGAEPVIKDEEPEEVEEKEIRGEDVHKEIPKEIETIL